MNVRSAQNRISRSWPWLLLPAILLLATSCGGPQESNAAHGGAASAAEGDEEEAIAVRVAEVVRQPLSSLYTTSATLRADKQATVTARTSGVVRELLV